MKRRLVINPSARILHIPKELIDDGFDKETDGFADAFTLTIVKPGASLEQVKKSLQLVIQDLEMRIDNIKEGQNKELEKVSPS